MMLTGLKVAYLACKCVFYRAKQNAKGGLNFEDLYNAKIKYTNW